MNISAGSELAVSVRVITYNHEKYIEECLNSILTQKTDFQFDIVVGDDCSTDNTREILNDYANRFPDKIKLIFHKTNLGSNLNIFRTNNECHGKYIAWCDGDDFWTDNGKLQKQYDLLEKNDNISICFNNANIVDEGSVIIRPFLPLGLKPGFVRGEKLFKKWLITNSSVFFRNGIVTADAPSFVWNGTHGDLVYYLLLMEKGYLYYDDNLMSVYRVHSHSITATGYVGVEHSRLHIKQCRNMQAYFNGKYKTPVKNRIIDYSLSVIHGLAARKEKRESVLEFRKLIGKYPFLPFKHFKSVIKIFLLFSFPNFYLKMKR